MSNYAWHKNFTERQIKEIEFCLLYAKDKIWHEFLLNTVEHNTRMIIAQMAEIFNEIHYSLAPIGSCERIPRIEEIMGHREHGKEDVLDLTIGEIEQLLNIICNSTNSANDLLYKKLVTAISGEVRNQEGKE